MRAVPARCRGAGYRTPERDVRRRRARGLVNFFDHDAPLATAWRVYEGSAPSPNPVVTHAHGGRPPAVRNAAVWATINAQADASRRGDPLP